MSMELMSTKLVRTHLDVRHNYGGHPSHWCPGCGEPHSFAVDRPFYNGARWSFDGNVNAPTFNPSMNISVGPFPDGRIEVCHYFLQAGRIQFLGDCTHKLVDQTVDLPDLPESIHMQIRMAAASTRAAE
jgi:hypothetical protein